MNGLNQTMKWHNVKIVLFIIGALIVFSRGGQYISGNVYNSSSPEVTSEMIYSIYGNTLKIIDVIYGTILVAFAILQIYICISLKKMKRNSPKMFTCVYSIELGINLVYNIILTLITGIYTNLVSSIITTICCGIFTWLDYNYYEKRMFMFTN